jgi:murein DD-endopeptidase MepM/ murein hydrolase activator NlpD
MMRWGFRAVVLAVGVVGLAACSAEPRYPITPGETVGAGGVSVAQPRYPINPDQAPPTQPPSVQPRAYAPPPSDDGAAPRAAPTGDIQTQPLGAPGSAPPSRPPAATYPATGGEADLRGRQTDGLPLLRPAPPPALEIPHNVQVQPFESVYDVAERVRTPLRALIDLNRLRPPYTLTAGMILRVPPPVVYTVREGDTLFGVARRFSIDPRSLANLNDIPLETRAKPGQRLALPPLVVDRGPNPAARGARPEGLVDPSETAANNAYARPTPGQTSSVTRPSPAIKPEADRAAVEPLPPRPETSVTSESQIIGLGKGKFIWPLKGEILSSYGPKGAGQRNDGVNIAATTGDPVKAAAAGTVVYAGNSIPAFGNLVLVKHPGGWATLYGNLGKITVKNNAQVSQGEEVGTAGVSGSVDKPQVHFEIRYAQNAHDKAKPYDPASLLP